MEVTTKLVNAEHTLAFHRLIFAAVDRRQPDQARTRMIDHLKDANELLARAIANPPRAEIPDSSPLTPRQRKVI
jgi:GntR family transcriptional repressor for pyruvate dehydrogenase complex